MQDRLLGAVGKAKCGDMEAATNLYHMTERMAYFTALKIAGDEDAAQDIVQDAYIKIYSELPRLQNDEAFISWVKVIVINLSKNYIKRQRPFLFTTNEEEERMLGSISETNEDFLPEEYADRREKSRLVMEIVDNLPEAQRMTVILYYYDGCSVGEVAQVMEVSEGTVKSRLNYARKQIKDRIEALERKETKLYAIPVFILSRTLHNASLDYSLPQNVSDTILSESMRITENVASPKGKAGGGSGSGTGGSGVSSTFAKTTGTSGGARISKAVGNGLGLGTKIAAAATSVALIACVAFGVITAINTLDRSVPVVTREEYARAVGENTALKKKLAERADFSEPGLLAESAEPIESFEPTEFTGDSQDRIEENAMSEPEPKTTPESDPEPESASIDAHLWKQMYLTEIQDTIAYTASIEWDEIYSGALNHDPDSRYPMRLYSVMLADINFDGIPELMTFGDGAGSSSHMRIFSFTQNGVEKIYQGEGNPPYEWDDLDFDWRLYRRISDGNLVYMFSNSNGTEEEHGGNIYLSERSTPMDHRFEESVKIADFVLYYHDGEEPSWFFSGLEVNENEYNTLMENLTAGYEVVPYTPIVLNVHNTTVVIADWVIPTDIELQAFLDSYVPEGTA